MNALRFLLVSFAFASAGAVMAEDAAVRPKAQIGGIPIGLEKSKIEGRLGKPKSVVRTGDALDPEIHYDGLTIWLWDGKRVAQIASTNSKFCVTKTVCPGVAASIVQNSFGAPQRRQAVQEGINSYLLSDAETCWLDVIVEHNTVQSLEIRCQP